MKKPIAWFLTWTTYGTWLHGDPRGSWESDGTFVPPDELRREWAESIMTDDPVTLTIEQRRIVDSVIVEHCRIRGWLLHARNVRTQHVHAAFSASIDGEEVRSQLKKWGSIRLSEDAGIEPSQGKNGARRWWTEKGNVIPIWTEKQLEEIIKYINELQ